MSLNHINIKGSLYDFSNPRIMGILNFTPDSFNPASRVTDNGEIKERIEKMFAEVQKDYPQPLAVEKLPLENYYAAEDYHQDYLDKNPDGYCHLPLSLFEFARKAREK